MEVNLLWVILMLASGVFYLICAAVVWKPFREEKNELIGALFAFLVYQSISMIFMGIEMYTHNHVYLYISSLAVFIGSAYLLKFPYSFFGRATRRILFYLTVLIAVSLFIWFIQTKEREMLLMDFTIWYDLIINGLVAGGFILAYALKIPDRLLKIKALGGGSGIISCCIVANIGMLTTAILLSAVFQFLAPVLILASLVMTRKKAYK